MKRAQAAVMDALVLMMICSAAATLLLYVTSIYGSNSNRQIMAVYDYEYANTALLSLRYVDDNDGNSFWGSLKTVLTETDAHMAMEKYFSQNATTIFSKLMDSSPGDLILQFEGRRDFYCLGRANIAICVVGKPESFEDKSFSTYAVATAVKDLDGETWTFSMKIFF